MTVSSPRGRSISLARIKAKTKSARGKEKRRALRCNLSCKEASLVAPIIVGSYGVKCGVKVTPPLDPVSTPPNPRPPETTHVEILSHGLVFFLLLQELTLNYAVDEQTCCSVSVTRRLSYLSRLSSMAPCPCTCDNSTIDAIKASSNDESKAYA